MIEKAEVLPKEMRQEDQDGNQLVVCRMTFTLAMYKLPTETDEQACARIESIAKGIETELLSRKWDAAS